jgi:hypothetical protein
LAAAAPAAAFAPASFSATKDVSFSLMDYVA